MSIKHRFAGYAAFCLLACTGVSALADDHSYSEGPVVNVGRIRTVDGHFDDYMKWLSTTWKQEQEAAKKAGYILSYQVMQIEPRGPDDADLLLMVTYKNWAALDGAHREERRGRQASRGLCVGIQSGTSRPRQDPARSRLIDDAGAEPQIAGPATAGRLGCAPGRLLGGDGL